MIAKLMVLFILTLSAMTCGQSPVTADNGNSYQGTLYVVFDTSGNGKGYYQFAGQDYEITISKKG